MLRLEGVSRSFGGMVALDNVSLILGAGECLGLIGPNGSGKSTLFNVITGISPADSGKVILGGRDITRLSPDAIARAGIARTVQTTRVFERLTVMDNVRPICPGGRKAAAQLLEITGLKGKGELLAGSLGFAERRRLDIARALALTPQLLLLDEPAGALTREETDAMAELIARAVLPDRSVIIIEHKIDLIARLCRRVAVLHIGRIIAEGSPQDVRHDMQVQQVYFGSEAAHA